MRHALGPAAAVLALAVLLALAISATGADREYLDIRVFTRVGQPGQPEPIAIGPDRRIYVGTNQLLHGDRDAPSKIFAYTRAATSSARTWSRASRSTRSTGSRGSPSTGAAASSRSTAPANPRVLVINPKTGSQRTYSRFRDVPPAPSTARPAIAPRPSATDGRARLRRLRPRRRPLRHRHRAGPGLACPARRRTTVRLAHRPAAREPLRPQRRPVHGRQPAPDARGDRDPSRPRGEPGAGALFRFALRRDGRGRARRGSSGAAARSTAPTASRSPAPAGSTWRSPAPSQIAVISPHGRGAGARARQTRSRTRPRRSRWTLPAASPSSAAARW